MKLGIYVFEAIDRPGMSAVRMKTRDAHRVHIRQSRDGVKCILGGPLTEHDGGPMIGTLLIFEADSSDHVRAFMADDPYLLADLFYSVFIRAWSLGLGSIAAS